MKETSSSIWTFQMIIVFMLIFSAFLALVLVYSKAYTIKNKFISVIEKYGGVNDDSINIMNNYANNNSYKATGKCPQDDSNSWYGVNIYENIVETAKSDVGYSYCFIAKKDPKDLTYYELVVFYRFSLPVFEALGLYKIEGRTNSFSPAYDIYE